MVIVTGDAGHQSIAQREFPGHRAWRYQDNMIGIACMALLTQLRLRGEQTPVSSGTMAYGTISMTFTAWRCQCNAWHNQHQQHRRHLYPCQ